MKDLQDLLAKYLKITPTEGVVREAVVSAISKVLEIDVQKEDISLSRDVVYVKILPSYKILIRQNKNRILEEIPSSVRRHINDIQ